MIKNCGTCGRWEPNVKYTRVGIGKGKCPLAVDETGANDGKGCWGWTQPSEKQVARRRELGLLE